MLQTIKRESPISIYEEKKLIQRMIEGSSGENRLSLQTLLFRTSGKKVRDLSQSQLVELMKNILNLVKLNFGIGSEEILHFTENPQALLMWAAEFQKKFGFLTDREISLAITPKVLGEGEEEIQSYGKLSLKFIFALFARYRNESIKRMGSARKLIEQTKEESKPSKEEVELAFIESVVLDSYQTFLDGFDPPSISLPQIYEHFESCGAYEVERNRKFQIFKEAELLAKQSEAKLSEAFSELRNKNTSEDIKQTRTRLLAQSLACLEAFRYFRSQGLTRNDLKKLVS